MNSNGSTPRGSVRSISTSPPASSVHSLEGSGGGTVVAVTAEEGGGGSGGEAVLAFSSGEGSGSGTVVVVISEEGGAVGEGPVSAGLGPPAVHPPASSVAASSAGDRRTDARVECPVAFMGESYPAFALARSQPRIWTGSRDGLEVPLVDPGRGRPDRGANNHTPDPDEVEENPRPGTEENRSVSGYPWQ